MTRGFSLIELLVALTVCALLSGAVAAIVAPARAAFESTPEALDLQQRGRVATDVLTGALRSAGRIVIASGSGSPPEPVPAVLLLDPIDAGGTQFKALYVMKPSGIARGLLEVDQPGASGPLTLSPTSGCPAVGVVCGFSSGMSAAIVDRDGRFEVFTVGAASPGAHTVTPSRALGDWFAAGSLVVEVEAYRYALHPQADGSSTLSRTTIAGAVQPIVDQVVDVVFEGWQRTPGSAALIPLTTADTDFLALRRVDILVRISARSDVALRRVPDRTFRTSVALRSGS